VPFPVLMQNAVSFAFITVKVRPVAADRVLNTQSSLGKLWFLVQNEEIMISLIMLFAHFLIVYWFAPI
jgi:hypothetical protein